MQEYRRKNFLTSRKYQIKYTAVILFSVLIAFLVIGATAYWDFSHYFSVQYFGETIQWSKYIIRFVFISFILSLVGIFLSHKVIGPIDRIEECMDRISRGDFDVSLKLRPGDEFYNLSEQLNSMASTLKKISEKYPELIELFQKKQI